MYLSKNNLYSNNHYWCQINVLSHYPLNVSGQSMSFTHPWSTSAHSLRWTTQSVFTCQHEVLFLFQVEHSVNTSGFSLIWNYSTVEWDFIHVILKSTTTFGVFFKQSTGFIEVSWNETRQRSSYKLLPCSCLYMNRNFVNSETFKFITVGQTPHVIRTNEFSLTFKRRTSFGYYSCNPDPRLHLYMKIWAGTRQFFTNPIHFLEVYWTKDCLYLAM